MKFGRITISFAVAMLCYGTSTSAKKHLKHHSLVSLKYDNLQRDLTGISIDKDIQKVISKARAEARAEFNKEDDMATAMDQKRWRDTEFRYVQKALLSTMKSGSD